MAVGSLTIVRDFAGTDELLAVAQAGGLADDFRRSRDAPSFKAQARSKRRPLRTHEAFAAVRPRWGVTTPPG